MRARRLLVGALVGAALCGGVGLGLGDTVVQLATFPNMPGAYEAKEYCSCRFVEGRDAAHCDQYIAQDVVPRQWRKVDEANKRVTARALWRTHSAQWVSERLGCVLETP